MVAFSLCFLSKLPKEARALSPKEISIMERRSSCTKSLPSLSTAADASVSFLAILSALPVKTVVPRLARSHPPSRHGKRVARKILPHPVMSPLPQMTDVVTDSASRISEALDQGQEHRHAQNQQPLMACRTARARSRARCQYYLHLVSSIVLDDLFRPSRQNEIQSSSKTRADIPMAPSACGRYPCSTESSHPARVMFALVYLSLASSCSLRRAGHQADPRRTQPTCLPQHPLLRRRPLLKRGVACLSSRKCRSTEDSHLGWAIQPLTRKRCCQCAGLRSLLASSKHGGVW